VRTISRVCVWVPDLGSTKVSIADRPHIGCSTCVPASFFCVSGLISRLSRRIRLGSRRSWTVLLWEELQQDALMHRAKNRDVVVFVSAEFFCIMLVLLQEFLLFFQVEKILSSGVLLVDRVEIRLYRNTEGGRFNWVIAKLKSSVHKRCFVEVAFGNYVRVWVSELIPFATEPPTLVNVL